MRLRLDVSMIGNAGKGYVEITHLLLKLLPGGEMSFSDHISFAKASHMATANFKGSRKKNHKKCNPNKCLENQELWTFDVSVVSLPKPVTWPQLTSKEVGKKTIRNVILISAWKTKNCGHLMYQWCLCQSQSHGHS